MTKIESIREWHVPGNEMGLDVEESYEDVKNRFTEGFSQFMETKKWQAVVEVLREDMPHLAEDENFVKQVVEKMGNDVIEEKQFVFLVMNPKLNSK